MVINAFFMITKLLTHINIFWDDINILAKFKDKNNKSILENIQLNLDIIDAWSKINGFIFALLSQNV